MGLDIRDKGSTKEKGFLCNFNSNWNRRSVNIGAWGRGAHDSLVRTL